MSQEIRGVMPIVHTPFDDADEIDWSSMGKQIDWAFQQGAHGFCTGMVSELLRLTTHERDEFPARLVEFNSGRGNVIASVGAESTKQAVRYATHADRAGCSAVMAIPPMSAALPAAEIVSYFQSIASAISIPVVIQDASAYVGQAIPIDVHAELLDEFGPQKILFKPEASPIGPNLSRLRDATNGRARIFEGSGGICLVDSFRRGIAGTMPGMEFLDGVVALWNALERNDEAAIYRIYLPICALVALQIQAGLDGFLAIEKYMLVKRGLFKTENRRRPNSWELDAETRDEVDRLFDLLQTAMSTTFC